MQLAKVTGNLVATRKVPHYNGCKLMIVQPVTLDGKLEGAEKVAADVVGAGIGETVFLVEGSSARMAMPQDGVPVDCAIIAIVDEIEQDGKLVFRKSGEA
ncbi:MAG TPA: EutN/CcmL family microcompartment protein [bacterium]|nr:EutN/CcmL family microcompartment protein [bacterium]